MLSIFFKLLAKEIEMLYTERYSWLKYALVVFAVESLIQFVDCKLTARKISRHDE